MSGRNQAVWDRIAPDYVDVGRHNWASGEAPWGIWGVPETEANLLPPLAGRDVIELGCGTGYVSSWMARRGGHPVAASMCPSPMRALTWPSASTG